MKNIWSKFLAATVILFMVSCSDFDDLNVDPNKPTAVGTASLFTNAMRYIGGAEPALPPLTPGIISTYFGTHYAQHTSDIIYTDDSRYGAIQSDFSRWYNEPLMDLQRIIQLNTDAETKDAASASGSNANQIALAKILRAYIFHHLTDRWGPLPYSQALQAESGILTPAYDSQRDIYYGLFEEIADAIAMMDGGKGVEGDFILNGDMDAWKRFANTMRMVMAMRISDVDAGKGKTEFLAAMNSGVITEDVMYPYLAESTNENPWFSRFRTRTDFAISELLANHLKNTNDPRLSQYADPTLRSVAGGNPQYIGMPYGLSNATLVPEDVSYPNSTYVKGQASPLPIFTMAQVHFAMAEAAVKTWISDNPETHYRAGIRASWDQWSVNYDDAQFNTYYNQSAVVWNGANGMALLAYQKWVSLYMQGIEAWSEWRRLDAPALGQVEDPLNPSGKVPLRNMYPATEQNLNGDQYNGALSLLGGPDEDGTRLWWDTK